MTNDSGGGISYAERLRTNINFSQRLQRNVLEVTLEKTENTAEIDIDQSCITRIMKSLGMDLNSQVEGCQVQFNGRSHVVSIWAAKGINLEKYRKAEGINVCKGCKGFLTAAEAENKRAGDNRETDAEETGRK